MPREGTGHHGATIDRPSTERSAEKVFRGFNPPTSNTTYTPNQLFDVALVHASRGCFRLVAYMLRKTLGWCDADGNPQEPEVLISYNDLVQKARVARGIIRPSIDEALAGKYIECVREGRPSLAGAPSITPLFRLKWDHSGAYTTNPRDFNGFYALQGYRTYVPNQFFDHVVPNEHLGIIKVVGTVIRHTIGWQNEYGFRRQRVQLSYTVIQRLSNLSRRALRLALSEALERNYIVRLKEGVFSPDTDQQEASTYGLKWLDHSDLEFAHEVQQALENQTGSKSTPGVEKPDRFKKYPRTGSINTPENRFKKYPSIKIKQQNKTSQIKQQQPATGRLAAVDQSSNPESTSLSLLLSQGFNRTAAKQIATSHPFQTIQNQINWLKKRSPSRNPVGMLRRAIEENWPEPQELLESAPTLPDTPAVVFARNFYAGRNGSDQEPVGAMPSPNDTQEANRFVQRLLEVHPDNSQVAVWGRRFGEHVRQAERNNPRAIISCIAALRCHGDTFYQHVKAEREEALRIARQLAEEDHYERFEPEYLEFIRAKETEIKQRSPERYQEWLERIQKDRFTFSVQKTEPGRLRAFARAAKLPDFWEWDERLNPERLERDKVGA